MTSVPPAKTKPSLNRWVLAAIISVGLLTSGAACEDELGTPAPSPTPWPTGRMLTWQWQLTGELDLHADADVFEFDVFTTPAQAVEKLSSRGRRMICHLNVGTYEASSPDADRFGPNLLGAPTASADGGRWLDIREWSAVRPILRDRLRLCRDKGFDAVDLVNIDAYAHLSGFPLSFDDQLQFNRRIAGLARSLGLSPGLHNDLDQVVALEPDFDFVVNEECFQWGECERLTPFVEAGKPVFHVEYEVPTADFCATTLRLGFSSIRKDRQLGSWRVACLP